MEVVVDGRAVEVEPGATVLEAIRAAGADVPTLCYDPRQAPFGACRVCLVQAAGAPAPIPACTTPCREGLEIDTRDERARRVVTAIVELVLSELPEPPAEHTELAAVARGLGLLAPPARVAGALGLAGVDGSASATSHASLRWTGAVHDRKHDRRHPYLAFRHELCISCGRCVRACDEVQGAFALTATGRGFSANVTAGLDAGFRDSTCVSCGACADTCPTDAITEIRLLDIAQAA